jgi:hypothetical protein
MQWVVGGPVEFPGIRKKGRQFQSLRRLVLW